MENTKNLKKSSEFSARPYAKRIGARHFYGFNANFTTFYENKMAAEKISTSYGFRMPGKHIFAHSARFGLHFALTKTTAICMYFSVASLKVLRCCKNWRGHCTLLASLPQWEGHSDRLEYRRVRLLTDEKGGKFESDSTTPTRDTRDTIGQHLRG